MGRWLNAVKKVFSPSSQKKASKEKKKWGLGKPLHEDVVIESTVGGKKLPASTEKGFNQAKEDEEKQVLAMATTQAVAVVSRQTSTGQRNLFLSSQRSKREWAALKIQSAFRGCLARQAYRALKGLVRLQALVRGYAVRRQAAITLRSMQALVRLQAQMLSRRRHMAANPRSRVMDVDGDRGWLERWMASAFEGEDTSETSSHDQSLSSAPTLRKSRFANGHLSQYNNSAKMMAMGVSKKKTLRDTTQPMPIKAIGTDAAFISPCSSQRNGDEGSAASSGRGSLVSAPPRYYNSHRRSLAGSICEDNESLTSLPAIPNYMSVTESARAKIRSSSTPKPRPTTPDKASSISARRKLCYPSAEPPPVKAKSGPLRPLRSGSLNKSHDFMAYSGPLKFDKPARQ